MFGVLLLEETSPKSVFVIKKDPDSTRRTRVPRERRAMKRVGDDEIVVNRVTTSTTTTTIAPMQKNNLKTIAQTKGILKNSTDKGNCLRRHDFKAGRRKRKQGEQWAKAASKRRNQKEGAGNNEFVHKLHSSGWMDVWWTECETTRGREKGKGGKEEAECKSTSRDRCWQTRDL